MIIKLLTGTGEITYGNVTKFEMEYPSKNPSISHHGKPEEDVYYPETIMCNKYDYKSEEDKLVLQEGQFMDTAKRFQFKSGSVHVTVITDQSVYLMNDQGKTVESY